MSFTAFEKIATVSLGYKSLQNNFFYVNEATISTYGIESRFLIPILMLSNLDPAAYLQDPKPDMWLFHCRDKELDLRGTGALRYIETMAEVSAADKKQSGKPKTIREVLSAQSGGLWYAPKARPHKHHIWIRKAFHGVFSPFIFERPALIDQRCNSVEVNDGFSWAKVAACLTSTAFAYSVEINGAMSMGAGVLEAPTTKIRGYPVLDVASLSTKDSAALEKLARNAWSEPPVDWSKSAFQVQKGLRKLDEWILAIAGAQVSVETLYKDLHDACQSRLAVAKDKAKKTKKQKTENIGNVADAITEIIRKQINAKRFPEDFVDAECDLPFHVSRELLKSIRLSPLLGDTEVLMTGPGGTVLLDEAYPRAIAEGVVRAVLWGRSSFSVSSDDRVMNTAITRFLQWASMIFLELERAIASSALGTGYEEQLRSEVFRRLGISPLVLETPLPQNLTSS